MSAASVWHGIWTSIAEWASSSEPIVVDGVAYVSAPLSVVYAVDAASGKLLWKFDPKIRLNLAINGSYSARTNGGVAVWNGKVYVGTGDCRLIAIDAASGKQLWDAAVCDATQTGITGAPHVAKGKVLMGYNGSDDGVRGSLVAYRCGNRERGMAFLDRSRRSRQRIRNQSARNGGENLVRKGLMEGRRRRCLECDHL